MDRTALRDAHHDMRDTAAQHVATCHRLHDLVLDAIDDGTPAATIADLLGVHRQRVYAYARSARERRDA